MKFYPKVLLLPIESLNLSPEFNLMALVNSFDNFHQIIESDISKLPELRESGYRMLVEALHFLDQHGLLDMVEDFDE